MKNIALHLMKTENEQTQESGGRKMKTQRFILGLVALSILLFAASVSAGVPQMINYQGVLTDPDGCAEDGDYTMIFRIYDTSADGNLLWEEVHDAVTVTQGNFNVLLGSINPSADPIPYSLFLNDSLWLAVKVEEDPEMEPRQRIASVGYAFRSEFADTADHCWTISDGDWIFRITDGADTTLITGGAWGIARYGNELFGNADSTHVNLGVSCSTGASGQDLKYCTVGGGFGNTATGWGATVGGGLLNTATYFDATVGGGANNIAEGITATVGGGHSNTALHNYSTVGGGQNNTATNEKATIGGGYANTASGVHGTVGGGYTNTASDASATVGGGANNTASSDAATVAGGVENTATEYHSTVGGGYYNTASGLNATVGGGYSDTASAPYATVPGGDRNTASGDYSFAAGRRAKANHAGTFVWGDNTDEDFASTGDNQFLIRASGGVGIGTTDPSYDLDIAGDARVQDDLKVDGTIKLTFDYNSGWVDIDPGQTITLSHNVVDDESNYIVDLYGKSSDGKIHQAAYGITCYRDGVLEKCAGCEWYGLTNSEIKVHRAPDDNDEAPNMDWDKCRVRILKNQ